MYSIAAENIFVGAIYIKLQISFMRQASQNCVWVSQKLRVSIKNCVWASQNVRERLSWYKVQISYNQIAGSEAAQAKTFWSH